MHRPRFLTFVLLATVAACGPAIASPSPEPTSDVASASEDPILAPSSPPAFGLTWGLVEDVERPEAAFSFPSDLPTAPTGPNTPGHPGNFPGQSILKDVALSGDRLVAVGYTAIHGVWTADSWTSTDGRTFALHAVDDAPGSFAVSVTAAPGGGFVAVGRAGTAAAAWTSADGSSWERAKVAGHSGAGGEPVAERMTVVLATANGLLAGGSAGPELLERHARFWSSPDGRSWTALPDDDGFDGAEIAAILRVGSRGYLALARLGDGQRGTGTVVLRSSDGVAWRRINDEALGSGLAVAAVSTEDGYLAVGADLDEREAVVWASEDGEAWGRAPAEPSRLHFGEKVRMTDVLVTGSGDVAIGNFVGVQYGTGTSWLTTTGYSWTQGPLQAALGQGEPEAMVAWGDRLVAVGSRGAPDNYIPSVWISPNVP